MTMPEAAAVIRRVLPAPPEVVYREWLDAESMAEWMCPRPVVATTVELDPRVGGHLRIDMDDEGYRVSVTGTYVDLDHPHRIRFTWRSSAWQPSDRESMVTVTLEPHGDGHTLMTIHHALLPGRTVRGHEQGWAQVAFQLETRLLS